MFRDRLLSNRLRFYESELLCENGVEHPRRKKSGQSPVLETLLNDCVACLRFCGAECHVDGFAQRVFKHTVSKNCSFFVAPGGTREFSNRSRRLAAGIDTIQVFARTDAGTRGVALVKNPSPSASIAQTASSAAPDWAATSLTVSVAD